MLLIIIILFYVINNSFYKNNEYFTQNIKFLKGNELLDILIKDDDNYYKTFFHNDLLTRNIKNIEHYINYIEL
jgi:hypothetical protein